MSFKVPSGAIDDLLIKMPLRMRRKARRDRKESHEEPTPGGKAPEDGPQTPTQPRSPQMDDMQKGASSLMSKAMMDELGNILKQSSRVNLGGRVARGAKDVVDEGWRGFTTSAAKKSKDVAKKKAKKQVSKSKFVLPSAPSF